MKNKLLIITTSLITFSFLSFLVMLNFINSFNLAIEKITYAIGVTNPNFWHFVTTLGETKNILMFTVLATIIFILYKKPFEIVALLSSSALGVIATVILKNLYQILRPSELFRLTTAGGFSFPSGHTLQTTAFFLTLSFLIAPFINKKSGRIILEIFSGIIIFAVGFSRIFLGVHWISDVIAGWLLGVVISVFIISFTSIIYPKLFKKPLF